MQKFTQTLLLFLLVQTCYSQTDTSIGRMQQQKNKKYVCWISPTKATHVYGVMLNFWPKKIGKNYQNYPTINGAEFNLCPLGLFSPFLFALYSLSPKAHQPPSEDISSVDFSTFKKINGLQIGLVNLEPSIINGLDINATGILSSKTNGLTLSGTINKHYKINGLTIGVIANHDTECNGVQIALINSCRKLRGVQIGLWNKNQKRSLPIINWCFRAE